MGGGQRWRPAPARMAPLQTRCRRPPLPPPPFGACCISADPQAVWAALIWMLLRSIKLCAAAMGHQSCHGMPVLRASRLAVRQQEVAATLSGSPPAHSWHSLRRACPPACACSRRCPLEKWECRSRLCLPHTSPCRHSGYRRCAAAAAAWPPAAVSLEGACPPARLLAWRQR